MNFSLSTWAIRNPIPPILLFLVFSIAGIMAFIKLPVNNMPNIVIPLLSVSISQPGASATDIETQITRKVENALTSLQGIKSIYSTVEAGYSTTTIEFHLEKKIDQALNDTREAITRIQHQLPRTAQEALIQRIDIEGGPMLIYSVEAPHMSTTDLSWFIDDTVNNELLAITGVAKVERQGGVDQAIFLTLDPIKLASLGISAAQVSRQLSQTNVDLPAGRALISNTEYLLRIIANAKTLDTLQKTPIFLANGWHKIEDLGTITEGASDPHSITRLNGKPAITLQIYRTQNASEVTVAPLIQAKLDELKTKHPDIHYNKIFSIADFTNTSLQSTLYTFLEGCFLTVLVVFAFLRDKRATFIAALTIPLSILPTFVCLHWLGFTLNAVSLLAISLVTGVLVDDAIVEIENIDRYMRAGKNPFDAAMIASEEIGLAVVATTLVICAVFLPVSFMGGIVGQYFKQFGLTVAIAAFFSLVVARLLTPMLAAYFFKTPTLEEKKPSPWMDRYTHFITWTLNNRLKTFGMAFLSFVLSFTAIPFLSTGFVPYDDYSESLLTLQLPKGSTLEYTDQRTQEVAALIKKHKEVKHVLTHVFPSIAHIQIKLVSPKQRKLDQRAFEKHLLPELKQVPDLRIGFTNINGQNDLSITLMSDDGAMLSKTAEAIEREMSTLTELSSLSTTASLPQPELIIRPDLTKAAQLGVSIQEISDALTIATLADVDTNLSKFSYGNKQVPIYVRFPKGSHYDLSFIGSIMLPTIHGHSVSLSTIADIEYAQGPSKIQRYNRHRRISLEANLNGISLGDALTKVYNLPAMKKLPQGVTVEKSGEAQMMDQLFKEFLQALGTGLLMVYVIQVLLYKNWLQPLTRMVALPLSIGGVFLLLLITGTELNMPVIIGILMLMGISDKNSILLVDCMLDLIAQGIPKNEAIVQACQIRARPIIMTSFAMLAGMVPIALGLGLDTAFRAPMAIAVIGGLVSSTALSLIFVPMFFSYVSNLEDYCTRKFKLK